MKTGYRGIFTITRNTTYRATGRRSRTRRNGAVSRQERETQKKTRRDQEGRERATVTARGREFWRVDMKTGEKVLWLIVRGEMT